MSYNFYKSLSLLKRVDLSIIEKQLNNSKIVIENVAFLLLSRQHRKTTFLSCHISTTGGQLIEFHLTESVDRIFRSNA